MKSGSKPRERRRALSARWVSTTGLSTGSTTVSGTVSGTAPTAAFMRTVLAIAAVAALGGFVACGGDSADTPAPNPDASDPSDSDAFDADDRDRDDGSGLPFDPDDVRTVEDLGDGDQETRTDDDADTDAEVTPPREGVPLSALCARMRADWIATCGSEADDECVGFAVETEGAFRCAATEIAIAAGRLAYDPVAAEDCLLDESLTEWDRAWLNGELYFCPGAIQGTGALGDPCYTDESLVGDTCATGYCPSTADCDGVCVAFGVDGDACGPELGRCAADHYCGLGLESTCRLRLGENAVCSFSFECEAHLACQPASGDDEGGEEDEEEGRCLVPGSDGDACASSLNCSAELVCLDGTCRAEVSTGDICTIDAQCPVRTLCLHTDPETDVRICASVPDEGEPCDQRTPTCRFEYQVCIGDGETTAGVCTSLLRALGETCGEEIGACHAELYCREGDTAGEGTCVPALQSGEVCTDMVEMLEYTNPCIAGLHCMRGATDTCLVAGVDGAPCNVDRPESCLPSLHCAAGESPVCAPPVAEGERCNLSAAAWRTCVAGECRAVRVESCDEATLDDCLDPRCVIPRDGGEECDVDGECASMFCDLDEGLCEAPFGPIGGRCVGPA